ncbi:PLP-dependent transferase [Lentithecium fluviatile CBS 122367]|uniref:PLP-dependent transferase n=1 Tax=Lentithecium fluviatile CBS 122367 TaxID=1168545 RepID=A0A6G1JCA3_9PLEO|nr:PLP-dependent transferase [Lentithecium fluviatile CBS 122367]
MPRVPAGLWKNVIAVQVYGANTGVGKTVFSTILGAHFLKKTGRTNWKLRYVKPVSTGPASEADDGYVKKYAGVPVSTLFQYSEAVSPHIAARDGKPPSDGSVIWALHQYLNNESGRLNRVEREMGINIVETAGGPLSPGPSGTPQVDLFRPLRLPVVLVGDHRLGGISSTISAAESLILRGYDINAVVCFNDNGKYKNSEYLLQHFDKWNIAAFELPWIPDLEGCTTTEETKLMRDYYKEQSRIDSVHRVAERIISCHSQRLEELESMGARTQKAIWHPFTQHKSLLDKDDILVFDSAYGDYFQTKYNKKSRLGSDATDAMLYPAFDGSASWWTQGLGHGNPQLALAAAHAAGRYGHVMFAGATHEPAITLAERLLKGMKNYRLTKCFFTDDGSTAAEVGIKMALRASCKRYEWDGSSEDVGILGLKGSYHGDTIGAMDASEPCVYNKKVDWYRGRGYWLDFPSVKMKKGRWVIEAPTGMEEEFGPAEYFDSLTDIFDVKKRAHSPRYEQYITSTLDRLVKKQGRKFGALVMEPVLLGAGGMLFVDPLFQRTLVQVVRSYQFAELAPLPSSNAWTGLPVMFDEVFTGLYRLGHFSAASLLDTCPDISIHAKLLTGGLLPLSATLASSSIFQAFYGDDKADALLHGHSYTAHPIGCHVANISLQTMDSLNMSAQTWSGFRKDWRDNHGETKLTINPFRTTSGDHRVWSFWSKRMVVDLSHHPRVDHVIAIGSVLAISLKDQSGSGYTSNAAAGLRDALLYEALPGETRIHSRVLGNVIYFMASMTAGPGFLRDVEKALLRHLGGPPHPVFKRVELGNDSEQGQEIERSAEENVEQRREGAD